MGPGRARHCGRETCWLECRRPGRVDVTSSLYLETWPFQSQIFQQKECTQGLPFVAETGSLGRERLPQESDCAPRQAHAQRPDPEPPAGRVRSWAEEQPGGRSGGPRPTPVRSPGDTAQAPLNRHRHEVMVPSGLGPVGHGAHGCLRLGPVPPTCRVRPWHRV